MRVSAGSPVMGVRGKYEVPLGTTKKENACALSFFVVPTGLEPVTL